MKRVDGKVAIITGAGRGMGRVVAQLFANEGAKVVVADISTERGRQTVDRIRESGGEGIFVEVDVSKADDMQKMISLTIDNYGHLDILYNNAAVMGHTYDTPSLPEDIYDDYLSVNLKGTWLGMKYSIPEMIRSGAGSIINVASIAALSGIRSLPHYSAAKGGVISLSRVTAVEYAAKNIRVNCICPGDILTPEQEVYHKANPDHLKFMSAMGVPVKGHMVPMGRSGRADEVANLALFLASDESSYITGSVITIDGGATASSVVQL